MSDQMPDEVWLQPSDTTSSERGRLWLSDEHGPLSHIGTRYIRADLYEQAGEFDHQGIDPADLGQHFTDAMQALTARNAVSKAACAQLIAEQAQRAEQAEAERDRLRAALERVRDLAEDGKTNACAMQVCEEIEMAAQEGLSHD